MSADNVGFFPPSHYPYGIKDDKGREIGCALYFSDHGPGQYAWRIHPTRDGEPFGALRPVHMESSRMARAENSAKAVKRARAAAERAAKKNKA